MCQREFGGEKDTGGAVTVNDVWNVPGDCSPACLTGRAVDGAQARDPFSLRVSAALRGAQKGCSLYLWIFSLGLSIFVSLSLSLCVCSR